jgi:hypothetical protein
MGKISLEDIKSIVKEIAPNRDYERQQHTDQIEASYKTNREYKGYTKDWDEYWTADGDEAPVTDFPELELVLEKVAPKITYLQVQKLIRNCQETDQEEVHDYYERYTLNLKKISLQKLYDYLNAEGLI